jgi:hypothetical protein
VPVMSGSSGTNSQRVPLQWSTPSPYGRSAPCALQPPPGTAFTATVAFRCGRCRVVGRLLLGRRWFGFVVAAARRQDDDGDRQAAEAMADGHA